MSEAKRERVTESLRVQAGEPGYEGNGERFGRSESGEMWRMREGWKGMKGREEREKTERGEEDWKEEENEEGRQGGAWGEGCEDRRRIIRMERGRRG
ncbi:hypothetical protein Pcinc_030066 [Petrolisthes cinctipes]|uniref:Uncharacterized protein n=1 Tax=Petrolisthes cinctipes TaxID=88211 RepID=A0AAE1K353_PETCI|nr:hypothetical protein Pcinc_030066 [Petrolisthes cinctipes]